MISVWCVEVSEVEHLCVSLHFIQLDLHFVSFGKILPFPSGKKTLRVNLLYILFHLIFISSLFAKFLSFDIS